MGDQIKNKDLFAGDAISKTTDDILKMIKALNDAEKGLKNVAKAQKEILSNKDTSTVEGVHKVREAIVELNEAEKISEKISKDKIKLEKRLIQSRSEAEKSNTELKVILQEQNKLNKELAKETLGLNDAYTKQSKRLNTLRKEYKSLALNEGKATKETKKLLREIRKLDKELKDVDESAGQFQRNVGNYPDSFGSAAASILGVAAAAVTAKGAFEGVQGSLEGTTEGSENVREATSKLGGVFDQVKNVVAGTALDLFDYGKAVVEGVSSGKGLIDSLKKTEGQFSRVDKATDNFTDKVGESADAQEALTKRVIEFEKAARPLEIRITKLNGLIQEQSIVAGDSTRSFEEIASAILKGQDLQVKRAAINVKLSREELEISQERVRIANLAGGAGVALLDAETQAIRGLIDAENDLKNEVLENEKELRQVKQDRLEIDLDILIDGFDNQKTINERIIANERETLEVRSALLAKTNKLAEDSFRGQKKVLEELSAAGIDVDDLLLLDATELAKQIRLLEQSEIINTRTLEVIRERRIVIQDLEEAQDDLNDSQQEGIDLQRDILAQEEALGKQSTDSVEQNNQALDDLEKDRLNNQKEGIKRRLENVKEGSIEELRLRNELNDLLLQQAEESSKKQEELEKKLAAERKQFTEDAINAIGDIIDAGFDKRISNIDDQLDTTEANVDRLRDKAKEGQLESEESLAFEQKQEIELARQREREQKRQERTKAFFAVLSSFNANDGNLSKTIADISVLKALAGGFTAFDGVDDTGGRGNVDSKGGRQWTLHPHEQVHSLQDRKDMRDPHTGKLRSRNELKDIVGAYDNGFMMDVLNSGSNELMNNSAFVLNGMNTVGIESKLDKLNTSIKAIQPIQDTMAVDEVRKLIKHVSRKGNNKKVTYSKLY
jgi:hypothetical protein